MTRSESLNPRRSERKRAALDFDFSALSQRAGKLYRGGCLALVIGAITGGIMVLGRSSEWMVPYLMIVGPGVAMMWHWVTTPHKGLPLLPVFSVQHVLIYAAPLVFDNPTLLRTTPAVVSDAGLATFLFLLCTWGGWWLGARSLEEPRPSRWNLGLAEGHDAASRCLSLSFLLLGLALLFHVFCRTGLIFQIVPGGLFPVVRTFADAASALGGMLGALVIGGRTRHVRSWLFWTLVATVSLLSITDVLISGATGIVIAVAAGLALGMRRLPWRFLLITFGIIGFLNQGKFVMRERYWSQDANVTGVSLIQTTAFFGEWIAASSGMFFGIDRASGLAVASDDDGQSFLDRVDNLQNLTYVIGVMRDAKIRPLNGETYTLVPKLLIPRLLWPGKPRAHEGQVLLNLHFGRQASMEQTEKTYIAWGILPEAVGNFGMILGPIVVGTFLGGMIGLIEAWSRRIRLFSVEGILLLALLLKLAGSFEMVASILVTSVFQFLIASAVGGFLLYFWFGRGRQRGNGENGRRKGGGPRRTGIGRRKRFRDELAENRGEELGGYVRE